MHRRQAWSRNSEQQKWKPAGQLRLTEEGPTCQAKEILLCPIGEKEPKQGFPQGDLVAPAGMWRTVCRREGVQARRPPGGCDQGPGDVEGLRQSLRPALVTHQQIYSP